MQNNLQEKINNIIESQTEMSSVMINDAIKVYMQNNNLTIEDFENHGLIKHHPDKTVYEYRGKFICEIKYHN